MCFKLRLPERTEALRQNFPNMPRKNSPRRFSSVCTTETWVCVIIAFAMAEWAHWHVTPPSLFLLQHSVVTVPGDHHVHLTSPEVVAPAVSHFLRTKVLLLPTSATHKLWSRLQKQPRRRLGLFSVGIHVLWGWSRTITISVSPDIPKILFVPAGRAGNELDMELPVQWPSLIYCVFVVSPCSGRLSLCAENNLTQFCYISEAEECKHTIPSWLFVGVSF